MTFDELMEQVRPAVMEFQSFRDKTSDDDWDRLQDDYHKELVLDALTEIEAYLY